MLYYRYVIGLRRQQFRCVAREELCLLVRWLIGKLKWCIRWQKNMSHSHLYRFIDTVHLPLFPLFQPIHGDISNSIDLAAIRIKCSIRRRSRFNMDWSR